jgi:hypothetical protein
MERFTQGQRVKIAHGEYVASMEGWAGSVHRLRIADTGAWVRMDQEVPSEHRKFGGADERKNDLLLFPEECEPE